VDKKRKIEEYLDEHIPLNVLPSLSPIYPLFLPSDIQRPKSSFRYREVSPTSFGLDPQEILTATDAQLNEFVGLKKLAPYRPREVKEGDIRKYGKKKRLREWRKRVQEEGQDEEIRAMLRPEVVKEGTRGEADGEGKKKKKRKSRKKEAVEG
jgi:protein KRI1